MNAQAIKDAVLAVTKKWAKQRKSEKRQASRTARRAEAWERSQRVTIKEAAEQVMEEAYLKASANGTLPANVRQVMYAARPYIQEQTGETLDDQYFTQTILPDYMRDNPETTADWDVVFDARGHFTEPHTGERVDLGTIAVRNYLAGVGGNGYASGISAPEPLSQRFPTAGPEHRFGAILFIEKEGWDSLFEKVKLGNRFDISVMSTKGMSVTASRQLIDTLSSYGVPLLVLHDFDKSGFSIIGTLRRDTRRYEFQNDVEVIDLGLRLADVKALGLESEAVSYKGDPRPNLRKNGATDEEVRFLCDNGNRWTGFGGRRVELNAMPSDQLIEWIEGKLEANGVKKVVPKSETLEAAYRRAVAIEHVNQGIEKISVEAKSAGEKCKLPKGLLKAVSDRLRAHPDEAWDDAIAEIARQAKNGGKK